MILVTGATGLLGQNLVKVLISNGERVKLLLRKESDFKKFTSNQNLSFVIGDVTDIPSLEEAFQEVDYVYHCAGLVSFSPFEKGNLFKVNVLGTANIVNFCIDKNVEKLCHVSSVAAIGKDKSSLISDESTNWDDSQDNSYYGKTKYLGELEVWRGIEEELNAVIVNPSVILGPAEWNQSSMKLFKYVKEEHKYYTGGGNNFVDVRDVTNIMIQLMKSNISEERFIIAGDRESYQNLFDKIADSLKVKAPKKEVENWKLQLLWRLDYLKSYIFGGNPLLTKETANVSLRKHQYSSEKIIKALNYNFIKIDETINWVVGEL